MSIKGNEDSILKLFKAGLSSRSICKELGYKTTMKSSVNNFLKPYRESLSSVTSNQVQQNKLNIIYWDLESSLMEGYFFRMWDENIPMQRIKKHSHLLTASWAFNDGDVDSIRLTPEQVKTGDDLLIVVKMIEALNKADVMVTFNGKRFDTKLLNTRALYWGLPPINFPKHIDLMEQAKRKFKFPSNSMQNISKYLGEGGKLDTSGSNLWERCADHTNYQVCNNALFEMETYNKQDIVATRDLHYRMQGWMTNTPNLGVIANNVTGNKTIRCIHCGSDDVSPIDKNTYTSASVFNLYRCNVDSCRGVSRSNRKGDTLLGVV